MSNNLFIYPEKENIWYILLLFIKEILMILKLLFLKMAGNIALASIPIKAQGVTFFVFFLFSSYLRNLCNL